MMYELVKRNRYYDAEFGDEFPHTSRNHYQDWEEYHLPTARMHNATFNDWGIVRGLEVKRTLDGDGIEILPGLAIDIKGELITLSVAGQADIGKTQPGERDQQISAPFQFSTWGLIPQSYWVTIQFNEYLDENEGAGGKLEQMPWLRLQPTSGANAYQDDGSAIILALAEIDTEGQVKVMEGAAELPHRRRLIGETRGELRLQRSQQIDGTIAEVTAATLAPGAEGGLKITVPAARDTIALATTEGTSFATLAVQAATTHITGALEADGNTNLHGTLTVAKPAILQNGLTVAAGKVGIGTAKPKEKLHAVGDLVLGLDENNQKFIFHSRTNGKGDFLQITHDKPDGNWDWQQGITLMRDGKVGIGTKNPGTELEVHGDTKLDGTLKVAKSAILQSGLTVTAGKVGIGTKNPGVELEVKGDTNMQGMLTVASATTLSGNVGVGTAKPKAKLHAVGDLVLGLDENNQKFIFHSRTNSKGDFLQITHDKPDGNWDWQQGITLMRDGKVGIGTKNPGAELEVKGNTKLDGTLTVAEKVALKNGLTVESGKVGIGTTDPQQQLHVMGDRIRLEKAGQKTGEKKYLDLRADGGYVDLESSEDVPLCLNYKNSTPIYLSDSVKIEKGKIYLRNVNGAGWWYLGHKTETDRTDNAVWIKEG